MAKLEIPLFGIVENMSFLPMQDGSKIFVFGENGGGNLANQVGAKLLGRIPIDPGIGIGGDIGSPVVLQEPLSDSGKAFVEIARNVAAEASKAAFNKKITG